jgi:hypothetical protein
MARKYAPGDPIYERVGQIVDAAFTGQLPDPTGGATHFHNPRTSNPDWAGQGTNVRQVGNHRFMRLDLGGGDAGAEGAPRPPANVPVSNAETGARLDEYFEGNARRNPKVPTNQDYENRLLRFLNDNPHGVGVSSYQRDVDQQAALYRKYLAQGGAPVAPPGRSKHNHGNAADLSYESPAALAWAHANAGRYGLHFPVRGENWHVEPVEARGGQVPKGMPEAVANLGAPDAPSMLGFKAPTTPYTMPAAGAGSSLVSQKEIEANRLTPANVEELSRARAAAQRMAQARGEDMPMWGEGVRYPSYGASLQPAGGGRSQASATNPPVQSDAPLTAPSPAPVERRPLPDLTPAWRGPQADLTPSVGFSSTGFGLDPDPRQPLDFSWLSRLFGT